MSIKEAVPDGHLGLRLSGHLAQTKGLFPGQLVTLGSKGLPGCVAGEGEQRTEEVALLKEPSPGISGLEGGGESESSTGSSCLCSLCVLSGALLRDSKM